MLCELIIYHLAGAEIQTHHLATQTLNFRCFGSDLTVRPIVAASTLGDTLANYIVTSKLSQRL